MTTKKNRAAVALGRRGGKARAKTLTAAETSAIARQGAKARWSCDRCGLTKSFHADLDHEWVKSPRRSI